MNRVFTFILLTIFLQNIHSQTLPQKDTVLSQMVLANNYFMDKWPDPGEEIVTDRARPSNLWTRATYFEGLLALYRTYSDTNYYKYAVNWGESHEWKITYGGDFSRDGDFQCCGQTYLELYEIDNQPERLEPIKYCIDQIVNSGDYNDWSWVDAIQMAMPVYAKLGNILNDTSYYNTMHKLYMFSRDQHGESGLYNDDEHLWWRDRDFDPPHTTPNGKNRYWSRGNGWVIAALVRVLDVLPDTSEYRDEYITTLREMSDTLIKIQRYDGFWNSSLVDSLDFGGKETSGTAFFTYGIAWGINNGILDEATYKPAVVKAWNAMIKDALHHNGFLGWVQGTGKQPSDGQPLAYDKAANFEDYGLGAFLLAGSEVIKMAPGVLTIDKPNYDFYKIYTSTTGEGNTEASADSVNKYDNVILTAVPAEGWRFVNWEGVDESAENPITINVIYDLYISAVFEKIPVTITIQENEAGFCGIDGVISNDQNGFSGDGFANTENALGMGIDYSVQFTKTGTYTFMFRYATTSNRPANFLLDNVNLFTIDFPSTGGWIVWETISSSTTVEAGTYTLRLEATGNDGLGNIDYLLIEGDSSSIAKCIYTLTVLKSGNGRVTEVSGSFEQGESVEIAAIPESGWVFNNWSGGATGTTNPISVTMDADKIVTANFSVINSIPNAEIKEISVYPNITSEEIYIDIPSNFQESVYFSLIDITGKTYLKKELINDKNKIDISNLNPGVYFVRVLCNNSINTTKIIVL